jgi:hypothetical protein
VRRDFADVAARAMDALEQRLQRGLKDLVIVRTPESATGFELHVLYAAGGAGQPRQFLRRRPNVLVDHRLQDHRQIQFLILDEVLFLGTLLTQVQFLLFAFHDVREMDRRRFAATLTRHLGNPQDIASRKRENAKETKTRGRFARGFAISRCNVDHASSNDLIRSRIWAAAS